MRKYLKEDERGRKIDAGIKFAGSFSLAVSILYGYNFYLLFQGPPYLGALIIFILMVVMVIVSMTVSRVCLIEVTNRVKNMIRSGKRKEEVFEYFYEDES